MMICGDCGIGKLDGERGEMIYCVKFKKTMPPESETNCMYFTEKRYDGGELMEPETVLFMVEQELQSRKISGSLPFHI